MSWLEPVLAHGGHWYHSVLYVAPLLLTVIVLWWQGRAEKRRRGGDR